MAGKDKLVASKDHLLAGKDELLASQDALIQAQREQLGNYADVVRLHADRAQVHDQLVDSQGELIDRLTAENVELRRRLSMDSSNSSRPPSSDPPAAKAKRRTAVSQRDRSKTRKPGGQTGREGAGLAPSNHVDQLERVDPTECSTCGQAARATTRLTIASTARKVTRWNVATAVAGMFALIHAALSSTPR